MATTEIREADWITQSETREVMTALETACPGGNRFVGGCVRNTLLGQPVADIDIATRLLPEDTLSAMKAAGIRAIPTGIEHGTITAVCRGIPYEITTLRRDVETDGRRAVVAFTNDWAEDAMRRDFRINALYAAPDGKIYEPVPGGLEDIEARRVAFIGEAEERLREDHLRNLRFFRFTAWYADEVDQTGLRACETLRDGLKQIAVERIWKELLKLLDAPSPYAAVRAMTEAGVTNVPLPEALSPDRLSGLEAIENRSGKREDGFRRFLMLCPADKEIAGGIASRLRFSGAERDRLIRFAKAADRFAPDMTEADLKAAIYRVGSEAAQDALLWRMAGELEADWTEAITLARSWTPPVFPVKGKDLLEGGMAPGPDVGRRLKAMEEAWIANGFELPEG